MKKFNKYFVILEWIIKLKNNWSESLIKKLLRNSQNLRIEILRIIKRILNKIRKLLNLNNKS